MYSSNQEAHYLGKIGGVAFEMYQQNAGALFDNIMVCSSEEEAGQAIQEYIDATIEENEMMREDL